MPAPILGGTAFPLPTTFVPLRLHLLPTVQAERRAGDFSGLEGVLADLQAIEQKNVAFLLGPAGSGKTTLLGNYCRSLCDRLLVESGETLAAPFPIWLPCARIEPTFTDLPALGVFRDLSLADDQPIALLLDGLDEISYERQPGTVETLTDLLLHVTERPHSLALVTCRSEEVLHVQGLERLLATFPSYSICPPATAARRQLFAHLAKQFGAENSRAQEAVERIESALERYRSFGLAETPLLLTLFASVVLEDPELGPPATMRSLFDRVYGLLARQRFDAPRAQLIRGVLQHVAARLYRGDQPGHGRTDVTLTESSLFDSILDYCDPSKRRGLPPLEEMFRDVMRSGVLVGDVEQVTFVHRSFFEYFLALQLAHDISVGDFDLLSCQPFSPNIVELLKGFELDRQLDVILNSTHRQSFEKVRFRGGNAINLLRASGTEPRDLDLKDAVLAGADLRRADLDLVDFGRADLRLADFSYASLRNADWRDISGVSHPIQIEEGREIRCAIPSTHLDLVFVGGTQGEIIVLRGTDLTLHSRRTSCHDHTVTFLAVSEPNGWLFSVGYDERCHVWGLSGLERLASVPQRLPKCRALATYTPGRGTCYLVCGTTLDSILLYQVQNRFHPTENRVLIQPIKEQTKLMGSPFRSIQWSTDGTLLLIGGFNGALHWLRFDPQQGRLSRIPAPPSGSTATIWGTSISRDGRRAATLGEDGNLHLWALDGQVPAPLGVVSLAGFQQGRCVCLSEDGATVYCGDDSGNILALGPIGGRLETLWFRRVHSDSVYSLRLFHEGRHLLTCGLDARVSILDAATGLDPTPPYISALPPHQLSVAGLRVRADILDPEDRRYLSRRGAVLVESAPRAECLGASSFEYDVALSFAGKNSADAEKLASLLQRRGYRIFYDFDFRAELWGKDLTIELYEIYSQKARFCVAFASRDYVDSSWTLLELAAARDRLRRNKGREYLLVIDVDGTELPGISGSIGFFSLQEDMDPIAELLDRKLRESPA